MRSYIKYTLILALLLNGYTITYSQDFDYTLRLAQSGDAVAQYNLGVMYANGKGVRQDFNQSLYWYKKAANQGDAQAQRNLGIYYVMGWDGCNKDYSQAAYWLRKAAENGDAYAQFMYGYLYANGQGVSQDYSQAVYWCRKSAEQGYDEAQNYLGIMYANGQGVSQDYSQAVYWYRKSAEQDYAMAQNNLGYMYANGQGVSQDYSQALYWYRKSAEQDYAMAQNNLGYMYSNGQGVSQDYSQAVYWYRKAAEQDYAMAQKNLGYMYEEGKGVSQDYSQALYWYSKSSEQGNADAQNNLGGMYYFGKGISQDYSQALYWYRKSAEQGNALAQCNLGRMYDFGRGISQDYSQALYWYRKSAEQGNALAQNNLGGMYYFGKGISQDYSQAFFWYRKSAEQGNAFAQCRLGILYAVGKGVKQDYSQALYWYRKSAEQGDDVAKYGLGVMYEEGKGVSQDYSQALEWYFKSVSDEDPFWKPLYRIGYMYEKGIVVSQNFAEALRWYHKAIDSYEPTENVDSLYQELDSTYNHLKSLGYKETEKLLPAMLNIEEASIEFIDSNGNNKFDALENCYIQFKVSNDGNENGMECKTKVKMTGNSKGISIEPVDLNTIFAGETRIVRIPLRSDITTQIGNVNLEVEITEKKGLGSSPLKLTVQTDKFKNPLIKVVDYSIRANDGKLTKRKPFDLQIMVQNVEYGGAEDVTVEIKVPENVLLYEGNRVAHFDELQKGETQLLEYSIIINNNYAFDSIPILFKVSEKYGKYAENRTINLQIDQPALVQAINVTPIVEDDKSIEISSLHSDVDENLPVADKQNDLTFAVIIANETYQNYQNVDYALNDGNVMYEYLTKVLGIPAENIRYERDATRSNIEQWVEWLHKILLAYGKDAKAIFYYAGHGIPDESNRASYLLPVDGVSSNPRTCYKLDDLYTSLGDSNADRIMIFIDACFSGSNRGEGMLASARGVALKAKPGMPVGNMVVFSAAQGDETALPYRDEQHGMFTYFLLKKLKETSGNTNLKQLADYITDNVRRKSIVLNDKSQTPTVSAASAVSSVWEQWTLK